MDEWIEETDEDGRWLVNGHTRLMVEPSQAWIDRQPAPYVPPTDTELATLAAILDKDDAQVSAGELKAAALGALRRMKRQGRL